MIPLSVSDECMYAVFFDDVCGMVKFFKKICRFLSAISDIRETYSFIGLRNTIVSGDLAA